MEHENNKIKIPVPLTELIRNKLYRESTFKILNSSVNSIPSDVINLQDENSTIIFSSKAFDHLDDNFEYPPPFYITLTINEKKMIHTLV